MPYASIEDLPDTLKHHLPVHALEIYRAAFNAAWRNYADQGPAREEIAHKVAWAAVKRRYHKQDNVWVTREF